MTRCPEMPKYPILYFCIHTEECEPCPIKGEVAEASCMKNIAWLSKSAS
jgi:hypothetical protein